MRKLKKRPFFLLIFVAIIFWGFSTLNNTLKIEDQLWITQDEHPTAATWSPNDDKIAFISSYQGGKNIYMIDLLKTPIIKSSRGMYTAKYLEEAQKRSSTYQQLTFCKDTSFIDLDWSFDAPYLLTLAQYQNQNEIMLLNILSKKLKGTGIKGVEAFCSLNTESIIYNLKSDKKTVYLYNTNNESNQKLLELEEEIIGFTSDVRKFLAIHKNGATEVSTSNSAQQFYPLPIHSTKVYPIGKLKFVANDTEDKVQVIDLNNKNKTPLLLGLNMGQVSVSKTKKYIISASPTLGGYVIKRIPKPYR